ncbi:hypothetical protein TNCT_246091 [Trichonephila clavata]|uniref:Uncharacterized protein n=1 Tax=Trichonephila clavata TaxID=2740835 RepID=A0A8X6G3D2_TRICU|nr:hypothetical protein TNCT_246091 [Trichonephila clavata]
MAEIYIQPPTFIPNPKDFPDLPPGNNVSVNLTNNSRNATKNKTKAPTDNDGFVSPRKQSKKTKTVDSVVPPTGTSNSFSALAGADSTDLDQTSVPVADRVPPPPSCTNIRLTITLFSRKFNAPTPPQQIN